MTVASFKLVLPFLVACTCSGSPASESCPGGDHEEDASLLQMFRAGLVETKQSPVFPSDNCPPTIVGKDWVENWISPAVDDDSWANERDCYNLTRKDYKAGLAEFSTMFSGVQSCVEANQELLVEMAFRNILPPDDAPLPEGCHEEGLAQPLAMTSGKPCDKPGELPAIQNQDCVDAWGSSLLTVLGLIFGVLGLPVPDLPANNAKILADLLTGTSFGFSSTTLAIIKEIVAGDSSVIGAAKGVWDIFMAANQENLISRGMWKILESLSMWKKIIFGIRTLATIANWLLSGGLGVFLTLARAVLVGLTFVDLVQGWEVVWEECFAECTDLSGSYTWNSNPANVVKLFQSGCSGIISGSVGYTVSGSTAETTGGTIGIISGPIGSLTIVWSNGQTYSQQAWDSCTPIQRIRDMQGTPQNSGYTLWVGRCATLDAAMCASVTDWPNGSGGGGASSGRCEMASCTPIQRIKDMQDTSQNSDYTMWVGRCATLDAAMCASVADWPNGSGGSGASLARCEVVAQATALATATTTNTTVAHLLLDYPMDGSDE